MTGGQKALLIVGLAAVAAVTTVVVVRSVRARGAAVASIRARPAQALLEGGVQQLPDVVLEAMGESIGGPRVIYENEEKIQMVRGEDGRIEEIIRHIKVTRNE